MKLYKRGAYESKTTLSDPWRLPALVRCGDPFVLLSARDRALRDRGCRDRFGGASVFSAKINEKRRTILEDRRFALSALFFSNAAGAFPYASQKPIKRGCHI